MDTIVRNTQGPRGGEQDSPICSAVEVKLKQGFFAKVLIFVSNWPWIGLDAIVGQGVDERGQVYAEDASQGQGGA